MDVSAEEHLPTAEADSPQFDPDGLSPSRVDSGQQPRADFFDRDHHRLRRRQTEISSKLVIGNGVRFRND